MTRWAAIPPQGLALLLAGCAAGGDDASSRGAEALPQSAAPGTPSPADAQDAEPTDFGNATARPAAQAGGPAPTPRAMDAGDGCTGGFYLGSYECEVDLGGLPLPLMGDVSFVLEIDETVIDNDDCGVEFCPDLVIAEGSGTLFGLAGLVGFEAELDGGLDCTTGEFRAEAPAGVWGSAGSSDPNDPDALWTVFDPPFGMFDGSLSGQHMEGPPDRIAGDWDLFDSFNGYRCAGPFSVALQP